MSVLNLGCFISGSGFLARSMSARGYRSYLEDNYSYRDSVRELRDRFLLVLLHLEMRTEADERSDGTCENTATDAKGESVFWAD